MIRNDMMTDPGTSGILNLLGLHNVTPTRSTDSEDELHKITAASDGGYGEVPDHGQSEIAIPSTSDLVSQAEGIQKTSKGDEQTEAFHPRAASVAPAELIRQIRRLPSSDRLQGITTALDGIDHCNVEDRPALLTTIAGEVRHLVPSEGYIEGPTDNQVSVLSKIFDKMSEKVDSEQWFDVLPSPSNS
jgi:hypothetical protein